MDSKTTLSSTSHHLNLTQYTQIHILNNQIALRRLTSRKKSHKFKVNQLDVTEDHLYSDDNSSFDWQFISAIHLSDFLPYLWQLKSGEPPISCITSLSCSRMTKKHNEFGGPIGTFFVTISLPTVIYALYFLCDDQFCVSFDCSVYVFECIV